MRNPLRKRFKRELKTHAGRYVSIFVIYVLMVTIISGFLLTAEGVRAAYEDSQIANRVEDGQFASAGEVPGETLSAVEDIGVEVVENYYVEQDLPSGQTVRFYQERTAMNLATLWEGALPRAGSEVALDKTFADHHDFQTGDTLALGDETFTVSGLVTLVDYSSLFASNTDLMMDAYNFGVGVVSAGAFEKLPADDLVYTYSYRFDGRDLSEKERIDAADEIRETLVGDGVMLTGFLTKDNNQAISFFSNDLGKDIPMMIVFLVIIQVIMAFVFTVVISTAIEEEAAVVGTLLASGYRRSELIRHYLTLPVAIALAGVLLGNILSYAWSYRLFVSMYYNSYSLPPMAIGLNLQALLLTTVFPIVVILALNLIMLCRTLSLSPLKFLRRDLKRSKQGRAIRLPRLSFMNRFRMRVVLQNKGSYLILFAGIFFASFLLLFGISMQPLIERYVGSIEDAAVSEYQYILKMPYGIEGDELEEADAEKFSAKTFETYFDRGDIDMDVSFFGIADDSIYWDVDVSALAKNEAIICEEFCKKTGRVVGDTLTFTDPSTLEEYEIAIAGTTSYPAGFVALMSAESLNGLLDRESDYFNGYFSGKKLDIPDEYVASFITPDDMTKLAEQATSTFSQMVSIIAVAAVAIYLVVMYVLTKIVIDKNVQSISFMRVMGYRSSEIRRLYLNTTTFVVALSLLVSFPLLSLGLQALIPLAFIKTSGYIEPHIEPYALMLVAVVGFVCYLTINFVHMRHVGKIEMGEVLKSRE